MSEEHDRWREALLRRFATDLKVLATPFDENTLWGEHQRPADMRCCWVDFEMPSYGNPGKTVTHAREMCGKGSRSKPGPHGGCFHNHHKYEVFLA